MTSKKAPKKEAKTPVKNNGRKLKKNSNKRLKGEIISEDELERRGGLTGDETDLLTVYLQKFKEGNTHNKYSKKLKDLAKLIYEKENLYVAKHGGYKLMEISSIETKLCVIRRNTREREEEEKRQAQKTASNKYLQK